MQTSQVDVEKVHRPSAATPAGELVTRLNQWEADAMVRGNGLFVHLPLDGETYRFSGAEEHAGHVRLTYARGSRKFSLLLDEDARVPEISVVNRFSFVDIDDETVVLLEQLVVKPKMTMIERRSQAKARRLAAERAREEAFADAEVRKDRPLLLEWKTITRERLEQLVWTYPVQTVAYMAGVTDTAVGKKCDARAIATPWRGFWREVEQGYRLHPGGVPQRPPKGEEWRYREYARVALGKKKQVKRVRR